MAIQVTFIGFCVYLYFLNVLPCACYHFANQKISNAARLFFKAMRLQVE